MTLISLSKQRAKSYIFDLNFSSLAFIILSNEFKFNSMNSINAKEIRLHNKGPIKINKRAFNVGLSDLPCTVEVRMLAICYSQR